MASPKKKLRLASPVDLARAHETTLWDICCLCQRAYASLGRLVCPAQNPSKATRLSGYKTMANNLTAFEELGYLPPDIRYDLLSEGGKTIEETLIARSAKWHRQCALKVNSLELSRLRKRVKDGAAQPLGDATNVVTLTFPTTEASSSKLTPSRPPFLKSPPLERPLSQLPTLKPTFKSPTLRPPLFTSPPLKRPVFKSPPPNNPPCTASFKSPPPEAQRLTRSTLSPLSVKPLEMKCFICSKGDLWNERLRTISTTTTEEKVRMVARTTEDTHVKASLEALFADGDLLAQESRYHPRCLLSLTRSVSTPSEEEKKYKESRRACEALAFSDLVDNIQRRLHSSEADYVFPMSTLTKTYQGRVAQLMGVPEEDLSEIHSTRLREALQSQFPDLRLEKAGREYVFAKSKSYATALVKDRDLENDAVAFKRFVSVLRTELANNVVTFDGELRREKQDSQITPATLETVSSLLYGSSAQNLQKTPQAALSIAQLMQFNFRARGPKGEQMRTVSKRETSLPVFLSLAAYYRSRSKEAIQELHALGLGVSPTRVYQITSAMCHATVRRAEEEGFLCPSELRCGIFTIAVIDNVDKNFTSSTAQGGFHGTAISVFQVPTKGNLGTPRQFQTQLADVLGAKTDIPPLPDSYAVVKGVTLIHPRPRISDVRLSSTEVMLPAGCKARGKVDEWLDFISLNLKPGENEEQQEKNLSWAAFNAARVSENTDILPIVNTLLPLFEESSTSPSMVRHGMDVVTKITSMVHQGQTPVYCCDQLIYAVAKLIQWNWPEKYGEDKIVLIMGGLHIELAFLRVIGMFLEGSGWAEIICQSEIATEAGAEILLKASHIKRSRAAYEVTAAALRILSNLAFEESHEENETQAEWTTRFSTHPTVSFWMLAQELLSIYFDFVGSLRKANYCEFLDALRQMLPWFFAFDRQNYARWLTIHLRDLLVLPETAPDVSAAFQNGMFVLKSTSAPFSATSVDQKHEANNKFVKSQSGSVSFGINRGELHRWMLAGPQIMRFIQDFSPLKVLDNKDQFEVHHEQYTAYQTRFKENVSKMIESFLERGNPFLENGNELINVHTRDVLGVEALSALTEIRDVGVEKYRTFVEERIITRRKSIFDPIKRSNLKIFTSKVKVVHGEALLLNSLKMDASLFLRLFVISESRDLSLTEFFSHENQPCPPSISKYGDLRLPESKSDILSLLEVECGEARGQVLKCDALVIDASILPHSYPPKSKTFGDYWLRELKLRLTELADEYSVERVDLVWDQYSPCSLKQTTRQKRGTGPRRQVLPTTLIPHQGWSKFLQNDANKTDLFKLLGYSALSLSPRILVVTNIDGTVVTSKAMGTNLSGVTCSQLEEADARIIWHVADAARNRNKIVIIRTVDSDVVVLAVSYFFALQRLGLQELWINFGVGKHRRNLKIHEMAMAMGEQKSLALRSFHAMTGCDTTSSFLGKGKTTAMKIWKKFPEVTTAFTDISRPLDRLADGSLQLLERFVIQMYGGPPDMTSANEARKFLFKDSKKALLDALPPTSGVLVQHIRRVAYQAGHLWGQSINLPPTVTSPEGWGWTADKDGSWRPVWSDNPPIFLACRQLIVKCTCKKGCKKACSCRKSGLSCTICCTGCHGLCSDDLYDSVHLRIRS